MTAREDFSRLQIDEKSKAFAWMTADQIGDLYKNETVKQAIVCKKAADPQTWKVHDEVPECPEAVLYKVKLNEQEVESLRKTHGQSLTIEAEMDDNAAARLATSCMAWQKNGKAGASPPVEGQPPTATPAGSGAAPNGSSGNGAAEGAATTEAAQAAKAVIAASAAAEKQRKADEAKKKRAETKEAPATQATKWLAGVNNYMAQVLVQQKAAVAAVTEESKMDKDVAQAYAKSFQASYDSLKSLRDELEAANGDAAKQKELPATLAKANSKLIAVKADLKAFGMIQKSFAPKAAAKPSACKADGAGIKLE